MVRTIAAFAVIVVTGVGCAVDDTARGVIVRDSAGITIVETGATPASDHGWVVSDSPLVRIGTVSGAEEYQFFRASDGVILTDGTIVVVNGGTHEVRFYDAAGRFRHAAGGQGDGPGELRSPSRVFRLPGDSLMVVELRRLSWFGPDGAFLRSMPITAIRPAVGFADGSFAGTRFAPAQDPFVLGASRPQMAVIRWWPDSGDTTTLAILPGDAVFRMQIENEAIVSYDLGFGPKLSLAALGNAVVWGDGTSFEVHVIGSDGATRRIYRRGAEAVPVTSEAQRRYEEFLRNAVRTDNQRTRLERLFGEWTYPGQEPFFDRIIADALGNLWVREFTYDARLATSWSIVDSAGAWIGDIELPAGFEVWEIGEDYILGLERDASDVEFVVKYGLTR